MQHKFLASFPAFEISRIIIVRSEGSGAIDKEPACLREEWKKLVAVLLFKTDQKTDT
jgi:hypothetical protein